MIELEKSEYSIVSPLLSEVEYYSPIAFSVVDGHQAGVVFVDDKTRPAQVLICGDTKYYYLIGAVADNTRRQSLLDILSSKDRLPYSLCIHPQDWKTSLEVHFGKQAKGLRIKTFRLDTERFSANRNWREKVPPGCQMLRVDENLYDQIISTYRARLGILWPQKDKFIFAPEGCPQWQVILEKLLFEEEQIDPWMEGQISWREFAAMVVEKTGLGEEIVEDHLKKGLRGLSLNEEVVNLARVSRENGNATVLVTGNIDLFTEIVVPDLELRRMFDVIVNSEDYREGRKEILWQIAFDLLDAAVTYDQCLLIEDSPKNVELFRRLGGRAYQYRDDDAFAVWLADAGLHRGIILLT